MRAETIESNVEHEYVEANPRSAALHEQQSAYVPSGVTHSTRSFSPFPLFIRQCVGVHKWDVDEHEYVDYWLGHGSLLLGHAHPDVVAAVREQLGRGFHAGGETELGCAWAELVCKLVPSAEQVRFTACGGEATQLALRIARAFTGKNKILKFQHHFHGWHDAVAVGMWPPWELPYSPGIPPRVTEETLVVPCNDIAAVQAVLEVDPDIAAIILEPGGGFSDTAPIDPAFLSQLRRLTNDHGVVLIFDEVVTGFRYSTGGAQQFFGVLPDLTTLGKVVGGGLPSGAVAGRGELMSLFSAEGRAKTGQARVIPHHGTWNANPVAAAGGVATLRLVSTGEPGEAATRRADQLRGGLTDLFERLSLPAVAYGRSSIWKTSLGTGFKCLEGDFSNYVEEAEQLSRSWGAVDAPLRKAMLLNGVDLMRANGFTSSVHTEEDIDLTIDAFERSITRLRHEGTLEV